MAGVLAAVTTGGLAAVLPSVLSDLSADTLQVVLVLVGVLATFVALHQFRRAFQRRRGFSRFGTVVFGAGMSLAIAIPGAHLLSVSPTSLLSRTGGPGVSPRSQIDQDDTLSSAH